MFIVMFETKNEYYIMSNSTGEITAFETELKGQQYFQDSYAASLHGSYESSVSATIHWITFSPMLVEVNSLDDMKENLLANKPMFMTMRNVSGMMYVYKACKQAPIYMETGVRVNLMHDNPEKITVKNGEVMYPKSIREGWDRRNSIVIEVEVKRLMVFDVTNGETPEDIAQMIIDNNGRQHAWFDSSVHHEEYINARIIT